MRARKHLYAEKIRNIGCFAEFWAILSKPRCCRNGCIFIGLLPQLVAERGLLQWKMNDRIQGFTTLALLWSAFSSAQSWQFKQVLIAAMFALY
jgi:hypothetical protein